MAARLGVPLHAGERVRFAVIEGSADAGKTTPPEGSFRGCLAGLLEPMWEDFERASAIARDEFGFGFGAA